MPALPVAVALELARGARDALRQAAAVVTGTQGNYIRDGDPGSIYGKIELATARQACRRYADNPGRFSGLGSVRIEKACRPYLTSIGYGVAPAIAKPWSGGECDALYRVEWPNTGYTRTITRCSDNVVLSNTAGITRSVANIPGPIQSIVAKPTTFGNCGPTTLVLAVTGSDGVERLGGTLVNTTAANRVAVFPTNIIVERQDGLPDNCGPVLPDIRDPAPPPAPGPRTEPFNPAPDINIDIDVEINPDGTIDFDFGTGPITIDPFADDGAGGGPPPGDVGSPGAPDDTGAGGDAEGEAPPGSVLVGLKVGILAFPPRAREYRPGVYRGVAYVYMGTDQGLDQDYSGSMLSDGQFVFAEKDNLTKWKVSANNGFNLRVTPYYREFEA